MVRNPSRFSGSTGLRQNIVRNAAPKITPNVPVVKDYADPSVEIPQGFMEVDGSNHIQYNEDGSWAGSTNSTSPRDQPGYNEVVQNKDADTKEDDKVDYRTNNKRGGLHGLVINSSSGSGSGSGSVSTSTGSIFMDFANFWKDDEHKTIKNPDWVEGGDNPRFTTNWALATDKATAATAAAAVEDKRLADIKATENALHDNFSTFYVGGSTAVNPNQVKFDALRKETLTKDNKATGVMQNIDGKNVFQNWTQVAQNHGPNVKVNYGLTGNPMKTPHPGEGTSGTMTIGRSMGEPSHAGIQTAINKQQANRDFNLTLKTWQSEYLLGSRDDASKVKAKTFIEAQKKKYLDWGDQGGHGIGGYGELFGKELDRRYYNLFDSPNSPGQQNKYPGRKLTVAEKIKIKIDNGTATQADLKRYAILTKTPGNVTGINSYTGAGGGGADPTMGYSNFLGNSNSWY